LAEIDSVTPWAKLHKLIESFCPKAKWAKGAERPPSDCPHAARLYVTQQFFGLSDEGA